MVDLPYPECASDHEKELLFQAVKNLITECKKACEEAFVTKIIPDFVDLESRVYFLEE